MSTDMRNLPAPVVLHCDPDHAESMIERLRTAASTIEERFEFGVRTETVLLLSDRSASATSWSLGIDVLVNGRVSHEAVVSCLFDWPLAGIQRMPAGRLPADVARIALEAVIEAIATNAEPDSDREEACLRRAAAQAPDWIDEARAVDAAKIAECRQDARWNVLVERDSSRGTPFVCILGTDAEDDVRIDTMIPDERISALVRRHPAHVETRLVDDLIIVNACDVDGPVADVDDDPLQTLRRMARDRE